MGGIYDVKQLNVSQSHLVFIESSLRFAIYYLFCSFLVRVTSTYRCTFAGWRRKNHFIMSAPFTLFSSTPPSSTAAEKMKEKMRKTNNFYIPLVSFHPFQPPSWMVPSSEKVAKYLCMWNRERGGKCGIGKQ